MGCYGLTIPGTATSAAATTTSSKPPDPVLRMKPAIRISFGSLRTRATVNDRAAPAVLEMSFYELLGIPETGTLPEIKQAYKQLARKYHPDVSPPDQVEESTKAFIRVQEAYETLSDPQRRAIYDRDMSRGLHLAFSARRRYQSRYDEDLEERGEWKNQWKSQLSELKRRSVHRDAGNMSWGARMRLQREELSQEL